MTYKFFLENVGEKNHQSETKISSFKDELSDSHKLLFNIVIMSGFVR